jgi:hypothetical protein
MEMEQAVLEGPDVEQDAAKSMGPGGEVALTILGGAAVKALELSDQVAAKAQEMARRRRRKYRRSAKKQARKLDRRVAAAARRLQVAMPVEKRRHRGRRVVLLLVVVGGGVAAYLAWRSRQDQGESVSVEAGQASDALGAGVEPDGEGAPAATDITSP